MTLFDLILIAVSLSMDAFAVSICKGLSVRKVSLAHALTCGVWFGGFQFLMPTLGYFLGDRFATLLTKFGPWVAFVLLALIGANMVKESFGGDEQLDDDYSAKAMLPPVSMLLPSASALPLCRSLSFRPLRSSASPPACCLPSA